MTSEEHKVYMLTNHPYLFIQEVADLEARYDRLLGQKDLLMKIVQLTAQGETSLEYLRTLASEALKAVPN